MKVLTERLIDWQLENPEGESGATAFLASVSEKIVGSTCSRPEAREVWLPRVRTHPYRRPIGGCNRHEGCFRVTSLLLNDKVAPEF